MNFRTILNEWLKNKIDKRIQLFDSTAGKYNIELRNSMKIIKTTELFKTYFEEKTESLNKDPNCVGFIYIMYYMSDDSIIPLYIGRAEKKDGKLKPYQRWLDNKTSGHIYLLSKIIVINDIKPEKYVKWKVKLFKDQEFIHKVYFAIIPWYVDSTLIFIQDPVPIKTAEFLLIGMAGEIYPDDILNSEGISREGVHELTEISKVLPYDNLRELWGFWIKKYITQKVPLFNLENGIVKTTMNGRFKVLERSPEMELLIKNQVKEVYDDFHPKDKNEFDGLIYMMFTEKSEGIIPLYIGKAEKLGRKGTKEYSMNLKGVHRGVNKSKFARWGYGHVYHIGDLSQAIFQGTKDQHECYQKNPPQKYIRWMENLFDLEELKNGVIKLRQDQPVYFWTKAWNKNDIGLFGLVHCSLTFL